MSGDVSPRWRIAHPHLIIAICIALPFVLYLAGYVTFRHAYTREVHRHMHPYLVVYPPDTPRHRLLFTLFRPLMRVDHRLTRRQFWLLDTTDARWSVPAY